MSEAQVEFDSKVVIRGGFPAEDYSQEDIKNEPMFFNCDLDFAYKHGGEITRDFIYFMPSDWRDSNPVFDSRVHMLMKDWYPCIPGWHHDDIPRNTPTGQPNYENPAYHSEHLLGLVNAEICPTLFIQDNVIVTEPDINGRVYQTWDAEIRSKQYKTYEAESGLYLQFNADTFHTGTKAKEQGWRWFARASRNTDRQRTITNEIRRQVQVYLETPEAGW
jgi:hypothetical protein